jgi:hypothetical protein
MTDKTVTGNAPRPNEPAHTPVMAQYLLHLVSPD